MKERNKEDAPKEISEQEFNNRLNSAIDYLGTKCIKDQLLLNSYVTLRRKVENAKANNMRAIYFVDDEGGLRVEFKTRPKFGFRHE